MPHVCTKFNCQIITQYFVYGFSGANNKHDVHNNFWGVHTTWVHLNSNPTYISINCITGICSVKAELHYKYPHPPLQLVIYTRNLARITNRASRNCVFGEPPVLLLLLLLLLTIVKSTTPVCGTPDAAVLDESACRRGNRSSCCLYLKTNHQCIYLFQIFYYHHHQSSFGGMERAT